MVSTVRRRRSAATRPLWLVAALIVMPACLPEANAWAQSEPAAPGIAAPPVTVVASRTLTDNGGRLDWCRATDTIAFRRVVGRGVSEVYTIDPDGSGERCLTCGTPGLPRGIRGQPAWHPSRGFDWRHPPDLASFALRHYIRSA